MSTHLYVTPGSYVYVGHSSTLNELVQEGFVMELVEILPSFMFIEHGYTQHGKNEWLRDHDIRYRS